MTKMKRVTIAVPDDVDQKILKLKMTNQFVRKSYSEIVRSLLKSAIAAETPVSSS